MITRFKLFEFYRGPNKAIGFKHYQEEGFALMIQTTKDEMEEAIMKLDAKKYNL